MTAETTKAHVSPLEWDRAVRIVHLVLAVIVLASLIAQIVLVVTGGADANSGRTDADLSVGARLVRLFSYFTIDSNLIVLVVAILLVVKPDRDGGLWRVARLDSLLSIVITGLVYAIVLAPMVHLSGVALWVTIGLHYISPWLTLAAWLLLGPRPRITWPTVGYAFIWPACWIGYTFARGAVSGWYPYPFLNADDLGYLAAIRNTALVLVVAGIVALMLKLIDNHVPALGRVAAGEQR